MDSIYARTFVRTPAGQREVVADALALPEAQRRSLHLVNGFTPMVDLAVHLADVRDVPRLTLELFDAGLIEEPEAGAALGLTTDWHLMVEGVLD
jgi:hypothetical protein